jgi:large subunit ribosomal protein L10
MKQQLQEKADRVEELRETLRKASSLVLADFRGVTVEQISGLRKEMRKASCTYRVVKNTLVKRAIAGTALEELSRHFKGPTAIAFSYDDPVAPAKILDKFAEDVKNFQLKAGYLEGEVLNAAGVKSLATMKGKDELRAALLRTFMAPAEGFVRLLAAAPTSFVYLLQSRKRSLG